ncbi:MAG: glycosyltransferase [Candidatus Promineifilaceae bacterium]
MLLPYVSVVIPAFNAEKIIAPCLFALANQSYPRDRFEVLLVDDGSADQTALVGRKHGAHVVSLPHNQGRSAARNAGAAAANGEILLFTDADCEPTSNWVADMIAPFQADATVVGVKGAYYCKQRSLIARFTQLELEDKYAELSRHTTISFIDTYSAAYRRDIFLANGGFDSTLNYSLLEDQDFSFRLAAQGVKLVFAPAARVYHQHLTSPTRYYWRKWLIGRWKTVILRRFPERRDNDSRTPFSLKLQFGIALLLLVLIPLALVVWPLWLLVGLLLMLFTVTALPFLRMTLRKDPIVGVVVLPMLLIRAFGLAHGYVDGLLRLRSVR